MLGIKQGFIGSDENADVAKVLLLRADVANICWVEEFKTLLELNPLME